MTDYRDTIIGNTALKACPQCGYLLPKPSNDDLSAAALYRPWHVRNQAAVLAYVESLADETHEWLLALFVDAQLHLIAVDTVGRGSVGGCQINFGRIYCQGRALGAAAFLLVHNHPSGDPTPSPDDLRATKWLRRISTELDLPLLDHLVVARGGMRSVGVDCGD